MSKKYLRQRHQFSVTLKKQVVKRIESGAMNVATASREYMVSDTSIYNWIHQYSIYNKKGTILVIDDKERTNQLQELRQRCAELERALGHKQMQIDYYETYIEIAHEELGEDVKKKLASLPLQGSSRIKKDIPG